MTRRAAVELRVRVTGRRAAVGLCARARRPAGARGLATGVALAVFLACGASRAPAQAVGESRGAVFLTLPSGARALSLGEAWSAAADDESALFYNPAQLALVRGASAGGSLQRYVASTTLGAFAAAVPLARGTVAIGVQLLDYGSEEEIVPAAGSLSQQGELTGGRVSAQDLALTAGYGAAFGAARAWRLGAAVKLAHQRVADASGSAVAGDVGVAYTAANGWAVAAALQHVGSRLTLAAVGAPLPWTWRAAATSPVVRRERFTGRAMAEARRSSGGLAAGVLAAEGTWRPARGGAVLAGRAGYALRGSGDDRSPLTLGGGVMLGRIAVDYAYEGFALLGGATHRVGVRFAAPPRGQ
ncbi:MAG TPA: hypothetical protein VJL28_15695 [Gemmatimonadaceae bacterium]|nr:hypothetical protein [Gemmatimonadaceae bacterium]